MDWADSDMFEPTDHENKPFSIRIPSLLVSRGASGEINFLTAMWYAPAGFNPSRMIVAVGKKTHSHHLILETNEFVMSAPTRAMMDVVVFAGRISGRDVNKWEATGLTPVKPSKGSVPLIGEANGNVEYKLVNSFPLDETNFIAKMQNRCSIWARNTTKTASRWASITVYSTVSNARTTTLRS
jgi:flavin reductase (DIM6/NTAB) family NADH-FMN oxidoreductase RutF